jgi:hypothetical protein
MLWRQMTTKGPTECTTVKIWATTDRSVNPRESPFKSGGCGRDVQRHTTTWGYERAWQPHVFPRTMQDAKRCHSERQESHYPGLTTLSTEPNESASGSRPGQGEDCVLDGSRDMAIVMPFGLCNAPGMLEKLMQTVFETSRLMSRILRWHDRNWHHVPWAPAQPVECSNGSENPAWSSIREKCQLFQKKFGNLGKGSPEGIITHNKKLKALRSDRPQRTRN